MVFFYGVPKEVIKTNTYPNILTLSTLGRSTEFGVDRFAINRSIPHLPAESEVWYILLNF